MSYLLSALHRQYIAALQEMAEAARKDEAADRLYDATLVRYMQRFEDENPDVIAHARDAATEMKATDGRVKALREQIRQALTGDKADDLPEGFKQTREKVLITGGYLDREDLNQKTLREHIMREMPGLLIVDMKALEEMAFALAVDDGHGRYTLPPMLERLGIRVVQRYKASISDATLAKLPVPPEPEPATAPGDTERFYTPVDPVTLKNSDTVLAHITAWMRVEMNDRAAKWECLTAEGYSHVNILMHTTVERLNNFDLFQAAGYETDLHGLAAGQRQNWTKHPIEVTLSKSGEFWKIVRVSPRADDAMPDPAIETTAAHIIGLKRGETSGSHSPKWDCTTLKPVPNGLRIFRHDDAKKDSFRLFQDAGYGMNLELMAVGETQDWTGHPIEVQIAETIDRSGTHWWNVASVTTRPADAKPDGGTIPFPMDEPELTAGQALDKLKAAAAGLLNEDSEDMGDFDSVHLPAGVNMDDIPF